MLESESNLLHLLDQCSVAQILDEMDIGILDEDATSTELLIHVLFHEKCQLLPDILRQLQYYDEKKWACTSIDELYPTLLSDGHELTKMCTVKEVNLICKTMEQHTNRCWFATGALKATNINTIIKGFGGRSLVPELSTRQSSKIFNPSNFTYLAKKVLIDDAYDADRLRISLGTVITREMKAAWFKHCTVQNSQLVPFADDNPEATELMDIFSYPEMEEGNDVPLFCTFDYTHILTNMRSHILKRGYDFCPKEDFESIVDNTT